MKFLSFLILFLCVPPVMGESIILPLQEKATATVDSLIAKGIHQINELDLISLRAAIKNLNFHETNEQEINFITAGRNSAFYQSGNIYGLEEYPEYGQDSLRLLATHEALGALGYRDENYQKTVLLELINRMDDTQVMNNVSFNNSIDMNFHNDALYSGGGASEVGGGGDINSLIFKYQFMTIIQKLAFYSVSSYIHLLNLQFEPNNLFPDEKLIRITPPRNQCSSSVSAREYRAVGILTYTTINPIILVPKNYLKMSRTEQNAALMDAWNFLSLYSSTLQGFNQSKFEQLSSCNLEVFNIHESILESEVLERSGGIEPFVDAFEFNCFSRGGE